MAELGIECSPVSVNVSRLEFYDPNLCQNLIDLVTRYGIDPSKLRLEITESAYADNMPQLLEAMDELQRFGFTVLMDDFGAGYSSLSMLRDVSVDMIKLDMRFLSHEDEGVQSRERNILQAVSYTHLDVYKRQYRLCWSRVGVARGASSCPSIPARAGRWRFPWSAWAHPTRSA